MPQCRKTCPPAELDAFWVVQGRKWIHLLKKSLGEGYQGYESRSFWLVSREPADTCRRLIAWAETTATKVKTMLRIEPVGRLFATCDEYFTAYLAAGEYAGSGGVYLNHGYGHFISLSPSGAVVPRWPEPTDSGDDASIQSP